MECCPVSAEGCRAILKVRDAPQRVFRVLSQPHILEPKVDQYQIDIVDALVRFAPEHGITWYVMDTRPHALILTFDCQS